MLDSEDLFKKAKENMIYNQLIPNGIDADWILNAMSSVNRDDFLPEKLKAKAYSDEHLIYQGDMAMFSPYLCSLILSQINLNKSDFVLCSNVDNAYMPSLIAKYAMSVVCLCKKNTVPQRCDQILIDNEVDNVAMFGINKKSKIKQQCKFNVVFVDGIVKKIDPELKQMLDNNGVLVAMLYVPRTERLFVLKGIKQETGFKFTKVKELRLNT
ncbi:MAG: hypothetical protein MJ247_07830 [Alphaproteobacteria bacterium]|nr:hypothetical protein [Alphaproteobacteria bacterium]